MRDDLSLHCDSIFNGLDARGFAAVLVDTIEILAEINRKISTFGADGVAWRITAIKMESPLSATLEGVVPGLAAGEVADVEGKAIVSAFFRGLALLEQSEACPDYFTEAALKRITSISRSGAQGVTGVYFSSNGSRAPLSDGVVRNAHAAAKRLEAARLKRSGEYTEHGSLEGRLTALIAQATSDKLVIIDELTGEKTTCFFRSKHLEEKARAAWKARICVTGEMTVDRYTGKALEMQVEDVRILRPSSELPQMEDLWSANIDITGGMDPVEYIRALRDAE